MWTTPGLKSRQWDWNPLLTTNAVNRYIKSLRNMLWTTFWPSWTKQDKLKLTEASTLNFPEGQRHGKVRYLLLDYCHPLWHKLGVSQTLNRWALMVPSRDEGKEKSYIRKCPKRCGYPGWAFLESTKKNKPERAKTENLIIISVITGTPNMSWTIPLLSL